MLEKKVTALEIVGKEGASHKWENKSMKSSASHSAVQKFMFKLLIPQSGSELLTVGKWFLHKEQGGAGERAVVKNMRHLFVA